MKTCSVHNIALVSRSRSRKSGQSYTETRCLKCQSIKASGWYHANKDSVEYKTVKKEYALANKRELKSAQLKAKFGITIDDYEDMLRNQQDCCAICKKHKSNFKKSLAVDHDHKTNKVRGLLCTSCNQGLGRFKDNLNSLMNACTYLSKDS